MRQAKEYAVMRCTATALALALLAPAAAQETYKLVLPHPTKNDYFGQSVAVSFSVPGAGQDPVPTGVVGAPGKGIGRAFIYDLSTGELATKLKPSHGDLGDEFGESVAISRDRVVVGAPLHEDLGIRSGAVFVYDAWTGQELLELSHSDRSFNDRFGSSVAIDGDRIVVGAPFKNLSTGAVYIFDANTGQQLRRIVSPSQDAFFKFGASVDLRGDLLVIGEPGTRSAFLFDASSGVELFHLKANDITMGEGFGASVAIGSNIVLVGSPGTLGGLGGSAHRFDPSTGQETGYSLGWGGEPEDEFGWSVALDEQVAFVGAPRRDLALPEAGAVYVFDAVSGELLDELWASEPIDNYNWFGRSVAAHGEWLLVGAPGYEKWGAAYVFCLVSEPVGEAYCSPANVNSTGMEARIDGRGCDLAAANRLILTADQLPVNQVGIFLTSRTQGFVPFFGGSQGNLCLGGLIGKFSEQVQISGPGGSFSIEVDLTTIPPLSHTVQPGETWSFQAWYRDMNPGPTSNFTDGVEVTFS